MAFLIADGGGSKTDWMWITDAQKRLLRTVGLNPNLVSQEEIAQVFQNEVIPWLAGEQPEQIAYFSAGLGSDHHQAVLAALLKRRFPSADKIEVGCDITGAGLACFGRTRGLVGILGTGSAAFIMDDGQVQERRGGLGYLIGDEGGGVSLGRAFIRALMEGKCSQALMDEHQLWSGIPREELIRHVYAQDKPHGFLAQQTRFLAMYQDTQEVRAVLDPCWDLFLEETLKPLHHGGLPIKLTGGVAGAFAGAIQELAHHHGLGTLTIMTGKPVEALAASLQTGCLP